MSLSYFAEFALFANFINRTLTFAPSDELAPLSQRTQHEALPPPRLKRTSHLLTHSRVVQPVCRGWPNANADSVLYSSAYRWSDFVRSYQQFGFKCRGFDQTIQYSFEGMSALHAGETLYVRGGTYTENLTPPLRAGTSTQNSS